MALKAHTAWVMDRGGASRLHEIKDLSLCRYDRRRDDTSESLLRLSFDALSDERRVLENFEPGRHELCIFRNGVRSWEGPLTRLDLGRTSAEIAAKDVSFYLNRTIMRAGYSSSFPAFSNGEAVIDRLRRVLTAELGGPGRKETLSPPYNVLPHIVYHQTATDARTTKVTVPYQMYVFEHLDDLAARNGIDYTVIGRAIHIWDTSRNALGQTRVLTEKDFLGDVRVSSYGAELATQQAVTDGQGGFGLAGAPDPYYGEWELLATAYDETEGGPVPTVAELTAQARRNLSGRNPTPVSVRVPENSSIVLSDTLKLEDLVPGVYVPLRGKLNLRPIQQMQKLNSVRVEETSDGEKVSVSLYPASKPDDSVTDV